MWITLAHPKGLIRVDAVVRRNARFHKTVMLQMKMEFPKLTVRENLGEENAKKKTVHG